MSEVKRVFKVNGKPFFPIGAEGVFSGGYTVRQGEEEFPFKALKAMHGNSIAIPVNWDQIEPIEGKFDFASVDSLLANARKYDLRLILLWFATWKNAAMEFAPSWVKTNPKRFKRVIDASGDELWSLSAHCKANLDADKKAFVALCKHLKAVDTTEHTVIAIQIENEPGIVGSDRDYSPEGEAAFNRPVPSMLISAIQKSAEGKLFELWQNAGSKTAGSWAEVFGWVADAGHLMYTWNVARYIDRVSEAGKAVYDIPTFINLWLHPKWWTIHEMGQFYAPDPVEREMHMDLFRWAAPHVDIIAPDNYVNDSRGYEEMCAIHTRHGNPLFMVETDGNEHMFRAIADYNCIGTHFCGIERVVDKDGVVLPGDQALADNIRCVASLVPLLLKYQGTGKIHCVIEETGADSQWMGDLDGYLGVVEFGQGSPGYIPTDYRHKKSIERHPFNPASISRGLVIQAGKHEFYLVGVNWRIYLRPKLAPDKKRTSVTLRELQLDPKHAHYVSVDEGYFDEQGKFVTTLRRNGSTINHGVWVEADIGVVRVIMCE